MDDLNTKSPEAVAHGITSAKQVDPLPRGKIMLGLTTMHQSLTKEIFVSGNF